MPAPERTRLGQPRLRLVLSVATVLVVGFAALGWQAGSAPPTTREPAANSRPSTHGPTEPPPLASTEAPDLASDACALLVDDDLAQILGMGGLQGKAMPRTGGIASQCAWNGPGAGFIVSVGTDASLQATGNAATPDAKAKFDELREQVQAEPGYRALPGIGDGAFLRQAGAALYLGHEYVEITNLGLTEAQVIQVAMAVVARL